MRERRLEEILDECLSAYLESGRSVEESLMLYSWVADGLEPLLRTAIQVSDSFEGYSPPSYLVERGRHRFLNAASTRRRARALTQRIGQRSRRFALTWGRPQWAMLSGSIAAASVAVVIGLSLLNGGGSGGFGNGSVVVNPQETPASPTSFVAVTELRAEWSSFKQRVTNGEIEPRDIGRLAAMTSDIARTINRSDLTTEQLAELEETARDQYETLQSLADGPDSDASSDEMILALTATQELVDAFDIPVAKPSPTDDPDATPEPSPSPGETPTPDPSKTPTPSPGPSPSKTPDANPGAPTPTPGEQEER